MKAGPRDAGNGRLGLELAATTFAVSVAIALCGLLGGRHASAGIACVLILGGTAPVVWRGGSLAQIGIGVARWRVGLVYGIGAAALGIPLGVGGMAAWQALKGDFIGVAPGPSLLAWFFYQVLLVVIPEEVFFRGYLQGTLEMLLRRKVPARGAGVMAMVAVAVAFALLHMLAFADIRLLWVFFPGLAMGWLRLRTHGLVASAVFHLCANLSYPLMLRAVG